MRTALICLLFLCSQRQVLYGQIFGRHSPQEVVKDTIITAYEENNQDSTVYVAMQRIMNGIQPISYLSPALLKLWPVKRVIPLRYGEGQKGYLLEGGLDQSFTLLQGRSQMDHFSQTSRVSFRYATALRMTQDNSSNLLPGNQKIGLQVGKVIWDSCTRNLLADRSNNRFAYADDNTWLRQPHDLHMIHAQLSAMHYSNGQPQGVYASAEDSVLGRNNYLNGDFSTNFINLLMEYSYYNESLFSVAAGYQQDGEWGGPFAFIDEQKERYGKKRITGFLQYRTRPVLNPLKKYITIKDVYHQRSYQVQRLWEHRFRLDFEYILGPLGRFRRDRDYRLSTHFFYELNPLRSRTAGLTLHLFYGRDYMNIRYDDIVIAAMAGVTFALNKYRHPRFNPARYVVKQVTESRFEEIRKQKTIRSRKDTE